MNSRILTSSMTIIAVVAAVVGMTYAFFSDVGESTGNVFSTGNLDMKLSDSNETDQDNVTATWGITTGKPNDTFSGDLNIKNTGSVNAAQIDLGFVNVVTESGSLPGSVATTPLDKVIRITKLEWDDDANTGTAPVDKLASVTDLNSNGIKDLDDLENSTLTNFNYTGTQNSNHKLHMEGDFDSTRTVNEHQGDSDSTTLTVTMRQT